MAKKISRKEFEAWLNDKADTCERLEKKCYTEGDDLKSELYCGHKWALEDVIRILGFERHSFNIDGYDHDAYWAQNQLAKKFESVRR